MKTVKANNFEKAIAELEGFSKDYVGTIKEAIPADNSKHFNAIMVKVIDNPGSPNNTVKVDVICLDKGRFERMKKNFAFHGYSKMIVLHDPSLVEPPIETDGIPSHIKAKAQAEAKAEMEAEIEAKAQAKFEAKLKEFEEAKAKAEAEKGKGEKVETTEVDSQKPQPEGLEGGEGDQGGEKISSEGIDQLTVDQLKEYAKDNEIDLTGLKVKDEIKGAVMAWIEDQNNQSK